LTQFELIINVKITKALGLTVSSSFLAARFIKTRTPAGSEPITRVLMNPPFALRGSDEHEYRFVSRALQMADGGIPFSLLPLDAFFGSRDEKIWRRDELLRDHTLLSVITMPDELFYPAAQKQVAGIAPSPASLASTRSPER
jgi:predicted RNA methylase